MLTKCLARIFFDLPKSSFGEHKLRSAFQNLRLGGVNISECVFEVLFKGVSTRFGQQNVESGSKTRSERFVPMWETTFARNSHAGLGKDFTKI